MVHDKNSELYAKQQKLLAKLHKIVGNKKLMFSDAYIKARKGSYHTLGSANNEMVYYGVTHKNVICPCRVVYTNNEDCTEYGAMIKKYSLYRNFNGQNVKQIALEDLFIKDLEQIVDDIMFFLWWENAIHFPQVKKEYDETLLLKEKYEKYIEK